MSERDEERSGADGSKTRIIIADDQPFLRAGLGDYLNKQPDLQTCGEAEDVAGALAGVERSHPDLLIIGLRLGAGDVLELIKSLRARFPELRVVVFSQYEETLYAERALRAGANGYIMKQEPVGEVITAVRRVLKGELYVSRKMASALLRKLLQNAPRPESAQIDGLSDREFQVFQMLGSGLGSRQIAAKLHLSIKTIETYRENIKHKYGLKTAAQLVQRATAWCQESNVVSLQFSRAPKLAPPLASSPPGSPREGSFATLSAVPR